MSDLKKTGMSFYKQDNSATETTNQKLNQRTNHILCGVTMFANLHALVGIGQQIDEVTPRDMQFEDYAHCILGNPNNYKKFKMDSTPFSEWWPSDPQLYPWLSKYLFGDKTIEFVTCKPTRERIEANINLGFSVGVCQYVNGFYHFKAISGYTDTGFLIVDSAPKLSGGKMVYEQGFETMESFSKYILICRGL